MDNLLYLKIKNTVNEIENQLSKDSIDPDLSRFLLNLSLSRISLLLLHIGYMERRYELTTSSHDQISSELQNILAENQRLNSIVKY